MTLSARAIALQGVGFGALPLAVQGFADIQSSLSLGGGGGSHGAQEDKEQLTTLFAKNYKLPGAADFEDEERIRAEIIRDDEEILTVIMSAVTSGALRWVH